jgi:hypothetical protein
MKRYRPVLDCQQQDTWTHRGQTLRSVRELAKAPGLRLAAAIVKVLEVAFTTPVVLTLGNASGDSALRSRTTSPNGVVDAKESTMYADMERLLLAAFVASRSVFTDAAMFPNFGQYPNLFTAGTADPEPGATGFVVSSPGIQTFSLAGLIILPLLLVFLLLVRAVLGLTIKLKLKSAVPHGTSPASNLDQVGAALLPGGAFAAPGHLRKKQRQSQAQLALRRPGRHARPARLRTHPVPDAALQGALQHGPGGAGAGGTVSCRNLPFIVK